MSPDTIDLVVSILHALAGIVSVFALVALIAVARWCCRRRDLTDRATRALVHARVGLTKSGEHRLPPDDDPIWLAGQRAVRKERRQP